MQRFIPKINQMKQSINMYLKNIFEVINEVMTGEIQKYCVFENKISSNNVINFKYHSSLMDVTYGLIG